MGYGSIEAFSWLRALAAKWRGCAPSGPKGSDTPGLRLKNGGSSYGEASKSGSGFRDRLSKNCQCP